MTTNPELELAFEFVSQTKRHLFLTGKAGTGKTTFLHRVRDEVPKRMAVVAPTGVAAINANGVTIHSLFQLPFGMFTPLRLQQELRQRRFTRKKINLIKGLDLLIIDEISMVRADVLDAIDAVLRRFRSPSEPFGGLQLLMIGDLHQLPPVVRPNEWEEMSQHYTTPYFFGSLALRKATPAVVQLKHIYRQSDEQFINLLNKVRNNQIDERCLQQLNQRYQPDFLPPAGEHFITLTSHNHSASVINEEKLGELPGTAFMSKARVDGDFPESMYPNAADVALKVGAQVMFNKNDTSPERQYFNGKIGTITAIEDGIVTVSCPDENPIEVLPVIWENRKYELNEQKEIEESIVGTYEQHPLKLAWAITIHKSQGLTFEQVIIDAEAAFAHGQVYVALSRCKTFEGIVLRTPIGASSVRTDRIVNEYSENATKHSPDEAILRADKHAYQADCLRELFNFSKIEGAANWLERGLLEHDNVIQGDGIAVWREIKAGMQEKAVTIGNKFLPWLEIYFRDDTLPVEHPKLIERLAGAAQYFLPYMIKELLPALESLDILTDNKSVRELFEERRKRLEQLVFTKLQLFQSVNAGFDPTDFMRTQANAEIDFEKRKTKGAKRISIPRNLKHRELYLQLAAWRKALAEETGMPAYVFAANDTLLEIAQVLPTSSEALARIGGFGKKRLKQHGAAILDIVNTYVQTSEVPGNQLQFASLQPKPPKVETKQQSLELYQAGKSIAEIATERDLTENTIFNHLTHWALEGEIALSALISDAALDVISNHLRAHADAPLKEIYLHFKEKYSFNELRLARKWLLAQDGVTLEDDTSGEG